MSLEYQHKNRDLGEMKMEFIPYENYLLVEVTHNYSLYESNKLFIEILDYLAFNKIRKVLVDCSHLQGFNDILEEYYHAEFAAKQFNERLKTGVLSQTKFAYLLNDHFYNDDKDGEMLANNRGLWNKTFDNKEIALEWLLKN